jgi:hypothetical protein
VLCLPRQPTAYQIALSQTKDIFRKADAVLVWDRDLLQRQKTADKDMIEMNMRLRTGEWSKRLWTFQEAALLEMHRLHIPFSKNNTVSVAELLHARNKARDDSYDDYHYIWKAGHPFSSPVWKLRTETEFRVQRAWESVQFRLLSHIEDEAIVLAIVFGLDVGKLWTIGKEGEEAKIVAAKRMVKLLDMIDSTPGLGIPSGIIFLPTPKLRIPST